jgi:3-hydroxy acid dehydrogenase/malonic semialdehyde reductase
MKTNLIKNKTAFITGASSGIGKACAEQFAMQGVHLIITARREERLNHLAQELAAKYNIRCTPAQLDVQDNEQVESLFKKLKADKVQIDILINNAGLALASDKLQDGKIENWDTMIDTNVKGLLYVTKAALPFMLEKNHGHIINIGSVAGHGCYPTGNVYCATKHAVRAISKSLRIDLIGTAIRVSEVDPGAVETEFSVVRWKDNERANEFYKGFSPLTADDIADAVIYCATRPLHVNVSELVVFPQAQGSLTEIFRDSGKEK